MGTNVLVFLQQSEGRLTKSSLVSLQAARLCGEVFGASAIHGVCIGVGAQDAGRAALEYGLHTVQVVEGGDFGRYEAVAWSEAVVQAARQTGSSIVVGVATSSVKDFFPRVSAVLGAGQVSDIIGVNPDRSFRRPTYAGNVIADVEIVTECKVVSVRGSAFSAADKTTASGAIAPLNVAVGSRRAKVLSYELSKAERPELGDARIVVSGGRALESAQGFEQYIFPLADVLGAAVGASRAAVDSGYAPNDWQVGQTGKVVAPELYIAVGISGAIQHLAGMKDSKTIVAINKDPDAPIFEAATYGLVADLKSAVPELTEALRKAKSS